MVKYSTILVIITILIFPKPAYSVEINFISQITNISTETTYYIKGIITDNQSQPLSDVTVILTGDTTGLYLTGTDGYYEFCSLKIGTYTVTPTKVNYTFSPIKSEYIPLNTNVIQNYVGNKLTYYIKGYVKYVDENGVYKGLGEVNVYLTGDKNAKTVTDNYGYYEFLNLDIGLNYYIKSEKPGYGFNPYNRVFVPLTANQDDKNFFAVFGPTYKISGYITDSKGIPVENVIVNLSYDVLGTVFTDINGYYEFTNLISGKSYQITPSKEKLVFSPQKLTFYYLDTDKFNQNFISLNDTIQIDNFKPINNLFNPKKNEKTTFWFKLTVDGDVSIKIYTLDGSLVKTVIDDYMFAGTYAIEWKGDDIENKPVGRGTYLVHINTPDFKITKKVIVIE